MADGTDTQAMTREPQPKRSAPAPRSSRRSWRQRLREDVPIVILAAILSVYIWGSFRSDIVKVHTYEGARIIPVYGRRDNLRASGLEPIDIDFECSQRVFDGIKAALDKDGLRLVVGKEPDETNIKGWRLFSRDHGDRYDFPSLDYVVKEQSPLPMPRTPARLIRLEFQEVIVGMPSVPEDELQRLGVDAEIELSQPTFKTKIPAEFFKQEAREIQPDPIPFDELHIGESEEDIDRVHSVTLTFDDWVNQKLDSDGQPDPSGKPDPQRKTVKLPDNIVAFVTLRRTGSRVIKHRLLPSIPSELLDRYDIEVDEPTSAGVAGAGQAFADGELRGTTRELDALEAEANRPHWYWLYRIDESKWDQAQVDKDIAEKNFHEVPGIFELHLGPELSGLSKVRFEPSGGQKTLTLRVEARQ